MPPHTDPARSPALSLSKWFDEEVMPHEPALRGYLRRQFPSVEADDVVQESYLKLWRAGAKVASAKAYFFAIARNTALSVFRRRKIFADTPVAELPEARVAAAGLDAAGEADLRQRMELAVAALDRLPARCREICVLATIDQLTPAEIAARLGITESTVYVQLARGVKRCAEYLRERGEAP
jgi:RNA polymerase sigma factor (sigma-70 family)